MANITRIKAGSQKKTSKTSKEATKNTTKTTAKTTKVSKAPAKKVEAKKVETKKLDKKEARKQKKAERKAKKAEKKANKKMGYFRGAWEELRQVRWPSRKDTWKMTLSVIVYVLIFAGIIMILDIIFQALSKLVLGV